MQHQEKWNKYCMRRELPLTFEDLPNKDLLDLRYFAQMEDDELLEETGQLLPPGREGDIRSQSALKGADASSIAGRTAGDSNSRVGSRAQLRRTESEILRDPEIWNISDSDDDFGEGKDAARRRGGGARSGRDSDDDENDLNEVVVEQEMARYLVEAAPGVDGMRQRSNIGALRRKTAGERTLILRRERAVKGLAELCILRCVRPDHLIDSMERFVYNVLNPNYVDFKEDILEPTLRRKGKMPSKADKTAGSAVELTKKILGQSKMTTSKMSKMSGTGDSQSAAQPSAQQNATSGSKLGAAAASGGLHDTKQSGMTGTQGSVASGTKRAGKEEQDNADPGARGKRGGVSSVQRLLAEAYEDSDARSPVLFLVTHAIDVQALVQDCLQNSGQGSSVKVWHFTLGKGVLDDVEEKMSKAAQNGDWIVLENLHLVLDWLPTFEEKIAMQKPAELHPRFRMWITSVPVPAFPTSILERSIKVAL